MNVAYLMRAGIYLFEKSASCKYVLLIIMNSEEVLFLEEC
jgi:hypothetical protein